MVDAYFIVNAHERYVPPRYIVIWYVFHRKIDFPVDGGRYNMTLSLHHLKLLY